MPKKENMVVAVAGHRWNRMEQRQEPQLAEAIAACFASIEAAAGDIAVSVLTGLAEGADQVAVLAMPARWGLIAVLPMPRQDYVRHLREHSTGEPTEAIIRLQALLERSGTKVIDPDLGSPEAGYLSIQSHILAEADLLLVIWDGSASAGRGGTTDTIARALQKDMPVVWIHSDQERGEALRQVTSAAENGAVSSELLNSRGLEQLVATHIGE